MITVNLKQRWVVRMRRSLLLLGIPLSTILLGLSWLGCPDFVTRLVLRNANQGALFIEAHDLKLDLRGGFKASDVSVYRKGVIGPPFLEARELHVLFRFLERPRAGVSRLKWIQARGGTIRLDGGSRLVWDENRVEAGGLSSSVSERQPSRALDLEMILSDFDIIGVHVDSVHTELLVDQEGVRLSGISGVVGRELQRGSVEGMVEWKRNRKAVGHVLTLFDPRALLPACQLLYPDIVPILERFSFSATPPRFDMSFEAEAGKPFAIRATGRMQASRYAYRGAGIGFANISVDYAFGNGTNRLTLDPFLLIVGGRTVEGKSTYDINAGTAAFEAASSIDLGTILRVSGLKEQLLESWHLEDGARVTARGAVNYTVPERSEMEAFVEGGRIGYGRVWASEYAFRYAAKGFTNQFTGIRGKIGNGSFSGSIVMAPDFSGTNRNSRITAELIHIDVDKLFELLSSDPAWRSGGKVYGNIELARDSDRTGCVSTVAQGQMTLRNSRIFKLPLFSGLMSELGRIVPELDFPGSLVDAHLSYELKDGRFISRDIQIDDGPVSMTARGSCGLDGTLDCSVTVHLMKRSGILAQAMAGLFSSGKGFEFSVSGTLKAPKWVYVDRR